MTNNAVGEPVAVVKGPKGTAEIFEITSMVYTNELVTYQVRFAGRTETFNTLGEAYIEAGLMVGAKT